MALSLGKRHKWIPSVHRNGQKDMKDSCQKSQVLARAGLRRMCDDRMVQMLQSNSRISSG
eukprot:scaffold110384_cov37-Prasinocladus_malaysianus.AAC.1